MCFEKGVSLFYRAFCINMRIKHEIAKLDAQEMLKYSWKLLYGPRRLR